MMAKKKSIQEAPIPEGFAEIEWHIPESLTRKYATNFIIRSSENEFTIYFFDADLPITVGTKEEVQEKLKKIKSIRANCISSVVVTPDKIPDFIGALQSNYEKYATKKLEELSQNKKS